MWQLLAHSPSVLLTEAVSGRIKDTTDNSTNENGTDCNQYGITHNQNSFIVMSEHADVLQRYNHILIATSYLRVYQE